MNATVRQVPTGRWTRIVYCIALGAQWAKPSEREAANRETDKRADLRTYGRARHVMRPIRTAVTNIQFHCHDVTYARHVKLLLLAMHAYAI